MPPFHYRSEILAVERMTAALRGLGAFLPAALGEALVTASYEFGCNLHGDLLYQPMRVGTQWLGRFIDDSLAQRIVISTQSDFRFRIPEDRLEILFCHEGDVHLNGTDIDLLHALLAESAFQGLGFQIQSE